MSVFSYEVGFQYNSVLKFLTVFLIFSTIILSMFFIKSNFSTNVNSCDALYQNEPVCTEYFQEGANTSVAVDYATWQRDSSWRGF